MYTLMDIAPTIAEILGITLPERDGTPIPIVTMKLSQCKRLILLIIDGLGCSIYEKYQHDLNPTRGITLRCTPKERHTFPPYGKCAFYGVEWHTTPAIATILTGMHPDHHRVFTMDDTQRSEKLSIIELANAQGITSAVIMEQKGARCFKENVEIVVEVDDNDHYDKDAAKAVIEVSKRANFITAHLRVLDRFYHQNRKPDKAIKILSQHIRDITSQIEDAGILICGDHPPHHLKDDDVPLIAISKEPNRQAKP